MIGHVRDAVAYSAQCQCRTMRGFMRAVAPALQIYVAMMRCNLPHQYVQVETLARERGLPLDWFAYPFAVVAINVDRPMHWHRDARDAEGLLTLVIPVGVYEGGAVAVAQRWSKGRGATGTSVEAEIPDGQPYYVASKTLWHCVAPVVGRRVSIVLTSHQHGGRCAGRSFGNTCGGRGCTYCKRPNATASADGCDECIYDPDRRNVLATARALRAGVPQSNGTAGNPNKLCE